MPDWVKNLFDDFPKKQVDDEFSEAQHWAKTIMQEADRGFYRDPYWTEYPLIQRFHTDSLKGDQLYIFRYVRSNPTIPLHQMYLKSGYSEQKFYKTINFLVQKKYLRLFSVYYSIDYTLKQELCNFITKKANVAYV